MDLGEGRCVMNLREEPRMILKFVPEIMPAKKGTQEWISEKDGVVEG